MGGSPTDRSVSSPEAAGRDFLRTLKAISLIVATSVYGSIMGSGLPSLVVLSLGVPVLLFAVWLVLNLTAPRNTSEAPND